MAEPTTTAVLITAVASAASVPILTVLGIPLGLRADWLMAGFFGALVAITLLNTVPSEGDTWLHLARTTLKRMAVSVASSLTAGYATPIVSLSVAAVADPVLLAVAFIIGAGAQKIMVALVRRFSDPGKLEPKQEGN